MEPKIAKRSLTSKRFPSDHIGPEYVNGYKHFSYEITRKTWNTDFIIVCQNLIGLYL